jgi:SCY1-like protein 2
VILLVDYLRKREVIMLAAATSFFSRTAISQSYSIDAPPTPSRTSSPSPATPSPLAFTPPCMVGLWKVQSAAHKTTGKRVSVWGFDKRGGMDGAGVVVEVLKAEVRVYSLGSVIRCGLESGQEFCRHRR